METVNKIVCQRQQALRNNPEKEMEKGTQEEDVGEDAARVGEELETQETERGATYNAGGDTVSADEWSTRVEGKTRPTKDKEGDAFEHIRKDGNQKFQEDQTTEMTAGPQFRDPEARYVPVRTWLAQLHDHIQGSATRLLKRGKRKWGMVTGVKGKGPCNQNKIKKGNHKEY
ncbi:hypothetical protein NDU88_006437 [Pleurodeles waltl]|uniref:Uncharacterized protein n=1 Tax=Pleurodeles waltl TaxID=8319 RepID=A0AAV7UL01_PLEWA|nr:hypothetical protein NDU88_006437 [Pleurodeles waltl]